MIILIAIIAILVIGMLCILCIIQHSVIIRRLDNIEYHINEVIAKKLTENHLDNKRNKEKIRSLGELCFGTECSLATQVNKVINEKNKEE